MQKGGGMTQVPGGPSNNPQWIDLLREATTSRVGDFIDSPVSKAKKEKYEDIYQLGGHTYTTFSKDDVKTGDKLSVAKIVEISKNELANFRELLKEGKLTITEFKDLTKETIDLTRQIVERRATKMSDSQAKPLRLVAYVLSAVASIFLVGIPFFYKLVRDDLNSQNEILSLKSTLKKEEDLSNTIKNKLE